MDISGLVKAASFNVKGRDHDAVLNELFHALFPEEKGGAAYCDLKTHESAEGILSGTGAAIFHCLSERVDKPVMAVAVAPAGIPHGKGRRRPRTFLFFLLVSPIKESGAHLQVLSNLEWLLIDRTARAALIASRDADALKRALRRGTGAGKSAYIPLSREEVFDELETSAAGLASTEAAKRLGIVGKNALKGGPRLSVLRDLAGNLFFNLFAVLLWAGGAMAFVAGMPELSWAIFAVIVINAAFSFWQEYKAEKAVEALERLLPRKVFLMRDGRRVEVDASEIVPGDVALIGEGDSVPADGRLIEAEGVRVDNSALTGESKPVYKTAEPHADGKGFIWTELPNLVFAGTAVTSGAGRMVVTATGMDTEIGRVASLTQAIRAEMSPLQREMVRVTRTVTVLATVLGAVFFALGYMAAGLTLVESFLFAVGIIVANVPEGLLPTVSLSLAMGVQRMASKKAIVKKLSAVETLGCATVILTDKTGTLTENRMCVTMAHVDGGTYRVTGSGSEAKGDFIPASGGGPLGAAELADGGVLLLLKAASLCSNASLRTGPDGSPDGSIEPSGDPTETAILVAAVKAGVKLDELAAGNPRTAHLPFERIRKMMSTVHEGADGPVVYVKGAPLEVLALSTRIWAGGADRPITPEDKDRILRENDALASRGLRVLAAATRRIGKKHGYTVEEVERDLVFIGLVAMFDPPRAGVKEAVNAAHTAGIKVVVATGDYGLTAKAVADAIGLKSGGVLTGEELARLSHAGLKKALKDGVNVFARVTPQDKLRLVTALQDQREVVAVTGDGVNDAPALKKADIGIAMGLRGSDVAKESAEIVLADDNFATIVEAVREGRAVYANIRKFVTYIFTHNFPEIIPFIAFVIFRIPLPLTVLQILAVDLATDIFPALALGVEPPEKEIMNRPPRPRGQKLLDFKTLGRAYLFLGPIEAVLCLGAFYYAYMTRGWAPGAEMASSGPVWAAATTMTFAGIVASQIGNVFACRTESASVFSAGFFKNRFVLFGIAAELVIAAALISTPVLRDVFGFVPPTAGELALLAVFPAVLLAADEARKAVVRALERRKGA